MNTGVLSSCDVLISEVGPRDGLQSVKVCMPTANKLRWIDALVASGMREIEVGSFVPAQHLPQMADVADVVHHALTHANLTVMALVPNLGGAQSSLAASVHELTIPVSERRVQLAGYEVTQTLLQGYLGGV